MYKPSSVSIATIHAVEAILPKASGYLSPGCHAVVGRALFSLLRRRIQNGSLWQFMTLSCRCLMKFDEIIRNDGRLKRTKTWSKVSKVKDLIDSKIPVWVWANTIASLKIVKSFLFQNGPFSSTPGNQGQEGTPECCSGIWMVSPTKHWNASNQNGDSTWKWWGSPVNNVNNREIEHQMCKQKAGVLSVGSTAAVRTLSLQQAEVLAGRATVKDCHNVSHNGIRRIHRHTLNKIPFKCSTVEQFLTIFFDQNWHGQPNCQGAASGSPNRHGIEDDRSRFSCKMLKWRYPKIVGLFHGQSY